MLNHSDILSLELDYAQLALAKEEAHTKIAARLEAGLSAEGTKSFRGEAIKLSLEEDTLIGQIGELAVSLYHFGNPTPYLQSRLVANSNPGKGDGGSDFLGLNVDVKASLMRGSCDPLRYNLIVNRKERHKNTCYYCVLVADISDSSALVHLVGWASESHLPQQTDNRFQNAFVLPVNQLNPFPAVRWKWLNIKRLRIHSVA